MTTPSPKRCATDRAISVASPASRAPTISSVTAWPAPMAALNPAGIRKAASAVPSATAARAAASVGTSVTWKASLPSSEPMTSSRSTVASGPPSMSATT